MEYVGILPPFKTRDRDLAASWINRRSKDVLNGGFLQEAFNLLEYGKKSDLDIDPGLYHNVWAKLVLSKDLGSRSKVKVKGREEDDLRWNATLEETVNSEPSMKKMAGLCSDFVSPFLASSKRLYPENFDPILTETLTECLVVQPQRTLLLISHLSQDKSFEDTVAPAKLFEMIMNVS